MLREVKFYARDILRGPKAKSVPAQVVSGALTGLVLFIVFVALVALL